MREYTSYHSLEMTQNNLHLGKALKHYENLTRASRSNTGTPEWVSSLEALKLAVGLCDFTCCQRNHKFGDKIVPCDRGITREILLKLIASKVKHLFETESIRLARLFHCMTQWWTRSPSSSNKEVSCNSLTELKNQLRWNDSVDGRDTTTPWIDRSGISLLIYAAMVNQVELVRKILELYEDRKSDLLAWRFPKEGVVEVGIPGHSTCLFGAMCFASSEIVAELLKAGADIETTDTMGTDPFMAACGLGRLDNVKTWLDHNSDWEVNKPNGRFGASALHAAVYIGQRKLDLVKYLVKSKNAHVRAVNNSGSSVLILACSNEDADPKVVQYLVQETGINVNHQIISRTMKWKFVRAVSKLAVRLKLTRSKIVKRFAENCGLTALHYAARRGDMGIVELLLEHGAKPSIENDLGRDVLS